VVRACAAAALTCGPLSAQGAQAGQALYQSNCAGCHGLDGRGGEHAPDIATRPTVRQLSDADLRRIIRDGISGAGMPPFGLKFSAEQSASVAGYVRVLQGANKTSTTPGNPSAGHDLFFGKAGCSECHMIAGKGGFIAGDLSAYAATHSSQEIRKVILDPNSAVDPHHRITIVTGNDGQKYTGVLRNEDNSSLQLQGRDGTFYLLDKSTVAHIIRDTKSLMPSDYSSKLAPRQVDDLISYLSQVTANQPKQTEEDPER
jgi:cytochrome c oxidase cbb3-type subunit 3